MYCMKQSKKMWQSPGCFLQCSWNHVSNLVSGVYNMILQMVKPTSFSRQLMPGCHDNKISEISKELVSRLVRGFSYFFCILIIVWSLLISYNLARICYCFLNELHEYSPFLTWRCCQWIWKGGKLEKLQRNQQDLKAFHRARCNPMLKCLL